MKKTKLFYWIFTILFAALMLFSAIPDILVVSDAVTFMNQLGYPNYFIPFIGYAKLLGVIAILIPGFPIIKEWAYAGLMYDLIGATYSVIAISGFSADMAPMFIFIGMGVASYVLYRKMLREKSVGN